MTVEVFTLIPSTLDFRSRLRGPVIAEDESAGTVDILGVMVTGDPPITEYQDVDDMPISQSQFHTQVELGVFVDARWDDFLTTATTADQLSIEDD